MRNTLITAALLTGIAATAYADYEETRELTLLTRGIYTVNIEAGAGSLDVVGVAGAEQVAVVATIMVPGQDDDEALKTMQEDMVLSLEKDSDTAVLKAWFEDGWNWGDSPSIHLEVSMPEGLHLEVDDGSGSLEIDNVRGDIKLDDGSGSVTMTDVGGTVDVEDGSGSLTITGVGGDITVDDGSGGIRIRGVSGSVTIDDGSGGIDVSDVENDLIIVDDGSGGLDYDNIGGRVQEDSR